MQTNNSHASQLGGHAHPYSRPPQSEQIDIPESSHVATGTGIMVSLSFSRIVSSGSSNYTTIPLFPIFLFRFSLYLFFPIDPDLLLVSVSEPCQALHSERASSTTSVRAVSAPCQPQVHVVKCQQWLCGSGTHSKVYVMDAQNFPSP